jgi:hypothetical protein
MVFAQVAMVEQLYDGLSGIGLTSQNLDDPVDLVDAIKAQ